METRKLKGKPRQLRRQRRLVIPQRARRHPSVRPFVVPPRRSPQQRAAAAGSLDEAAPVFLPFFLEESFLLGAPSELDQGELALEPPRGDQVPPAHGGLPGDPSAAPPALGVDAGEGHVEDLEGDESVVAVVVAAVAVVVAAVAVVVAAVADVVAAAVAAAVAPAAASPPGPSEIFRAQDELDRLSFCFLKFTVLD